MISLRNEAALGRSKPHVLFVGVKWCSCKPEYGETNAVHNLWGPLETSGLGTYELFHFDEYYALHGQAGDEALLSRCREANPDLIVLCWMFLSETHYNPTLETLSRIRCELSIPILSIWFDAACPKIMQQSEYLSPYVDLSVITDTPVPLDRTRTPEKYLSIVQGFDPRVFFDAGLERDIDLSFIGSVEGYPDRQEALEVLQAQGITVFKSGGQREHHLDICEYAQFLMRSKITLNFSFKGTTPQLKARSFEAALCGALLMESENDQTSRYFEPMIDYVPFSNARDLADKVRYYLSNEEERLKIARYACSKSQQRYTGAWFWRTVLDAVAARRAATDWLLEMGVMLLRDLREAEALAPLSLRVAQEPGSALAHARLALALQRTGSLEEAAQQYKRALEIDADNLEARIGLTGLRLAQGRSEEAGVLLEGVCNADLLGASLPECPYMLLQLGEQLLEWGRPDLACVLLKRVASRAIRDADLLNRLGAVLFQAGEGGQAEALLLKSSEIAPHRAEIWNDLAVVSWRRGDRNQAVQSILHAYRIAPNRVEVQANLDAFLKASENRSSFEDTPGPAYHLLGLRRDLRGAPGRAKGANEAFQDEPVLVGKPYIEHNIVQYRGRLYALASIMGAVNLTQWSDDQLDGLLHDDTMNGLKLKISRSADLHRRYLADLRNTTLRSPRILVRSTHSS